MEVILFYFVLIGGIGLGLALVVGFLFGRSLCLQGGSDHGPAWHSRSCSAVRSSSSTSRLTAE